MVPAPNNMYGVIKRECTVTQVNKKKRVNTNEILRVGTLIQIITDYKGEGSHFKIKDFKNWLEKYKNTIYKCAKDDYIVVTPELWPYLVASENCENRIHFTQKVNSCEFNMDLLKLDCNVRIRGPPDAKIKCFNFTVIHNGAVKQRGTGYYIGLQLKDDIPIPSEFQSFTQFYTFKAKGIVVSADWIMFNLYKEVEDQSESKNTNQSSVFSSLKTSANNEKVEETNAVTKSKQSAIFNTTIKLLNNVVGSVKNVEATTCDLCFETIHIGHGVILRECIHTFCMSCIRDHIERNSNCSRIKCPYINEYECHLNLLDVEIKDLAKGDIYNKILNNRLNEYKSTNTTVKMCPNRKCKNKWIMEQIKDSLYGQCPNCDTNWCYICSKAHKPDDRHRKESKGKESKHTNGLLESESAVSTSICDKCQKTNVISECTTLQQCKHTFCKDCFAPMIKTQTSVSNYIQCTICRKPPVDDEVSEIQGSEMLKLILKSRDNHPETAKLIEMCCCKPTNSNCSVVLQCKHKFCRTFLMGILQEQLQHISHAACPICLKLIDDCQKKCLVDQMKLDVCNKCRICSNRADIDLELCRHSFCVKCVRDLITNQVFDPSKMSINCTTCHDPIIDSDISRYGSEDIFALFKSKIAAAVVVPNSVEYISLNSLPFQCISCQKRISIKRGVILAGCRDCFCLACCKDFIGRQLANLQIPACPCCLKPIKQFEVEAIIGKPVDLGDDGKLECLKCEEKYEKNLFQSCSKCANMICLKCTNSTILSQIANKYTPSCPFCQKLFDESLIASVIKNNTLLVKLQPEINDTVELQFDCIVCEKSPDYFSQIVLNECKHEICRKCFVEKISEQIIYGLSPRCPMCSKPIDQSQLDELEISTLSKQDTKPNKILLSSVKVSEKTDESENANNTTKSTVDTKLKITSDILVNRHTGEVSFECIICEKSPEHFSQIVLINCKHELCRKCFVETISGQVIYGLSPRCPMCSKPIDQSQLDELEISTLSNQDTKPNKIGLSSVKISEKTDENEDANNTTKSKVHTIKQTITSDLLVNRHTEEIPFECLVCEQSPDRFSQIILINCKHEICRKCLGEIISDQINYTSSSPKCPICCEQIALIQLDTLGISTTKSKVEQSENSKSSLNISDKKDTCSVCFEKFRQKIILRNCGHEFCQLCVLMSVTGQVQANGTVPKCPMCRKPIGPDEIAELKLPSVSNSNTVSLNREAHMVLQLNSSSFKCPSCNQNIDRDCGITLANCSDSLCRNCILKHILQQSASRAIPICPICQMRITDEEVYAVDPAIHDIFNQNRLTRCHDMKLLEHDEKKSKDVEQIKNLTYDSYDCNICKKSFPFLATKTLCYCSDLFCRPCIATALNDQSFVSKVPTCPVCTGEVAGTDIYDLCGTEVFKRYLINKRNKEN